MERNEKRIVRNIWDLLEIQKEAKKATLKKNRRLWTIVIIIIGLLDATVLPILTGFKIISPLAFLYTILLFWPLGFTGILKLVESE